MGSCHRSRLRARLIGKLSLRALHRATVTFEQGVESKHPTQEPLLMYLIICNFNSNLKKYIQVSQ